MKIGVENFKIFKEKVEFDLNAVLILTGPNGSGKSTLAELIKLMSENFIDGPPYYLNTSTQSNKFNDGRVNRIENFERMDDPITFYYEGWHSKVVVKYEFLFERYRIQDLSVYYKTWSTKEPLNLVKDFYHHMENYVAKISVKNFLDISNTPDPILLPPDVTELIDGLKGRLAEMEINDGGLEGEEFYYYEIVNSPRENRLSSKRIEEIDRLLRINLDSGNVFSSTIRPQNIKSATLDHINNKNLRLHRYFDGYEHEELVEWCNRMVREIGLGDELVFLNFKEGVYSLRLIREDRIIELEENSTGHYNMLLLIVCLGSILTDDLYEIDWLPRLLVVEEPETYLHPDFQSKLALLIRGVLDYKKSINEDFFYSDEGYMDQTIIIETHSEYFIRKLQFDIAKGLLDHRFVKLYYFDKKSKDQVDPYLIEIMENGALSKPFGSGFFDEADTLAMDLFRHQLDNLN